MTAPTKHRDSDADWWEDAVWPLILGVGRLVFAFPRFIVWAILVGYAVSAGWVAADPAAGITTAIMLVVLVAVGCRLPLVRYLFRPLFDVRRDFARYRGRGTNARGTAALVELGLLRDGQAVKVTEWVRDEERGELRLTFRPPPGVGLDHITRAADAAEAHHGAWSSTTTAAEGWVTIRWLVGARPWDREWTFHRPSPTSSLIDLGSHAWNPDTAPHLLVVGETGAGKSSLLRVLVTGAHLIGTEVIVLDPKRIDFAWWTRFGVRASDPDAILDQLEAAVADMHDRYGLLEADPTTDLQRRVIVLDELAVWRTMLTSGREKKEADAVSRRAQAAVDSLMMLGRACRVHLVIGLQRPDASFLGGAARDQIRARIALGTLFDDGAKMVFGNEGSHQYSPAGRPGCGTVVGFSGTNLEPFACPFLDPAEAAGWCAGTSAEAV